MKSQLKTFRVMILILLLTVIGQCGFWIYQWKTSTCSEQKLPRFRLTHHTQVLSPAVSALYEILTATR